MKHIDADNAEMKDEMRMNSYKKWEIERTHQISLSIYEMQILLDAMRDAHTYLMQVDPRFPNRLDHRIMRLRDKVIDAQLLEGE